MTTAPETLSERDEVELLLPWYVTGKLTAADRDRVDGFLAREPALRRQLDLVRAEQTGTIAGHEAMRPPRSLSVETGMAAVAAATSLGRRQTAEGVLARVRDFFALPTAQGVRYAAVAAVAVFLLQAATIGTLLNRAGEGYQTASGGAAIGGATAIVKFTDTATAAEITAALGQLGMAIVDGPKPGGTFVVRLAPTALNAGERAARVADLRKAAGVVGLVLP